MRNLVVFIILFSSFSCERERILFTGPYHVRFTEATQTEKESKSKPIKIEVHLAGPAQKEDLTISYTLSGSAREGIDYEIVGTRGKVIIKDDEYFGYIEVQLLNNANNILRSQDVVFTLATVNARSI